MTTSGREELEQQTDLLKEEYIKLLNDKDVLSSQGKRSLKRCMLPASHLPGRTPAGTATHKSMKIGEENPS
ncbi:MAG: hypothetical protein ACXWV1_10360 [Chitinophagaceae bacterium]